MWDGWVYSQIVKGVYGLPKSGILANKLLETQLNAAGIASLMPHLAFGATNGNFSCSLSLSMTSVLNMLAFNMPITCAM